MSPSIQCFSDAAAVSKLVSKLRNPDILVFFLKWNTHLFLMSITLKLIIYSWVCENWSFLSNPFFLVLFQVTWLSVVNYSHTYFLDHLQEYQIRRWVSNLVLTTTTFLRRSITLTFMSIRHYYIDLLWYRTLVLLDTMYSCIFLKIMSGNFVLSNSYGTYVNKNILQSIN